MDLTENEKVLLLQFDETEPVGMGFHEVQPLTRNGLLLTGERPYRWTLSRESVLCKEKLLAEQRYAEEMAKQHAEQNEKDRRAAIKAEEDRTKQFRHDFHVAAFSVALALLAERFQAVVRFFHELFRSLFGG